MSIWKRLLTMAGNNPTDLPPLLAKAATLGRIDAFCGDDVKNIDYKHNPKEIYNALFH